VALAAHPDDPPVERPREAARSINQPAKYDRLIALHPSPMNQLELCLGSVQEMTEGSVYDVVDRYARERRIAYIHFRDVRGKVPRLPRDLRRRGRHRHGADRPEPEGARLRRRADPGPQRRR
jgi:D-mannonate dehydratase